MFAARREVRTVGQSCPIAKIELQGMGSIPSGLAWRGARGWEGYQLIWGWVRVLFYDTVIEFFELRESWDDLRLPDSEVGLSDATILGQTGICGPVACRE